MPEIGAYEAKTHLPKLLEQIQKGKRFTITKHGRPVAELIPVAHKNPEAVRQTIKGIRAFRESLRKRGAKIHRLLKKNETLRELAHSGHRY